MEALRGIFYGVYFDVVVKAGAVEGLMGSARLEDAGIETRAGSGKIVVHYANILLGPSEKINYRAMTEAEKTKPVFLSS